MADNDNYFAGEDAVLTKECLLKNLGNKYKTLGDKVATLSQEARARFLTDFEKAEESLLDLLQNPSKNAFKAWEKLAEITGDARKWVSKSEAILKKLDADPAKIDGVKNYYSRHNSPDDVNFYHSTSNSGIYYDKFGHPDFTSYVPHVNNKRPVFVPDPTSNKKLTGNGSDMTNANNWAIGDGGFIENVNFKKNGSGCKIKQVGHPNGDDDGWVECTWHYHEDGNSMIPVPVTIHARVNAAHIGGRQVINEGIQGFFNPPDFK